MKCQAIARLTPDIVAGNLSEPVARDVSEHLAHCPECRLEVESLGQIWQRLGLVPDEEPSDRLRARFYTALAQLERSEGARPAPSVASRLLEAFESWWLRPGSRRLATAAAALIVGLLLGSLVTGRSSRAHVEAMRGQVESLREVVAVSLLQQDSASARLQGVSYGRQVASRDERVVEALVRAATADPSANVRLAAIEALRDLDAAGAVSARLTRSLDETAAPLVQMAVVDLLLEQGSAGRAELASLLERQTLDDSVRHYLTTRNDPVTY